eukprot:COSAG02_NODE_5600_length_4198_cov_8.658858_3_plen_168_part_00
MANADGSASPSKNASRSPGIDNASEPTGPPRRRHMNTAEDDRVLCIVIVAAAMVVIARFVFLFHDRIRIRMGGEDKGGAGCYQMLWHACSFEAEVCCPDGCAAAGGLWVDGAVRARLFLPPALSLCLHPFFLFLPTHTLHSSNVEALARSLSWVSSCDSCHTSRACF